MEVGIPSRIDRKKMEVARREMRVEEHLRGMRRLKEDRQARDQNDTAFKFVLAPSLANLGGE